MFDPLLSQCEPSAVSWNEAYVLDGTALTIRSGTSSAIHTPTAPDAISVDGLSEYTQHFRDQQAKADCFDIEVGGWVAEANTTNKAA